MKTALILGAAVWPGGQPSPALRRRTEQAARAFHAGRAERIICCGGLGRHGPSEAEVMRDLLLAAGVPAQVIVLETRSSSTWENIAEARALCPEMREALIVTDGYHMPRARLIAKAQGLRNRAEPADRRGLSQARRLRAVLREAAALLKTAWQIARRG